MVVNTLTALELHQSKWPASTKPRRSIALTHLYLFLFDLNHADDFFLLPTK